MARSAVMSASVLLAAVVVSLLFSAVSGQTTSVVLGWQADPYATGAVSSSLMSGNDLHCDPIQTFSSTQLPSTGAPLQSFGTYYIPSSVSGVTTPVCRVGLYAVNSTGQLNLVAGTVVGNDIPLTYGTSSSIAIANSGASTGYTYPLGGSSYTVLPGVQYSLCFSNTALNISGGAAQMYLVAQATLNSQSVTYTYYPTDPLPSVIDFRVGANSTNTWLVWMNVQVPVSYAPKYSSSSSAPAQSSSTSPPYVPPVDYLSPCYGLGGGQNVWTWTYSYTMGCISGYSYGWANSLGVTCPSGNSNGTQGGWFTVNITLNMLVSTTAVYGSGNNTAYQICALLPGSQRTVGTWTNSQTGLVWQTTPLSLVPTTTPGACDYNIELCWNNWFYPYSGGNDPNGPASTTSYGLPYWFDGYGILYQMASSWGGVTYLNLFTSSSDGGNWVISQGGTQLMEETGQGPFGDVIEKSWAITASYQPYNGGCGAGAPTTQYQFNFAYTSYCTAAATWTGCTVGSGYYSTNLTLTLTVSSTPLFDNGANSPFAICGASGTRVAVVNPTGSSATTSTQTVTLATLNADTSQFYYNQYFYAMSGSNGPTGVNDGSLGLYYFFDNYGLVLALSSPWSVAGTTYSYVNLCTGNANAAGGISLQEEVAIGQLGVIPNAQSWSLSISPNQTFTAPPPLVGSALVHLFTFQMSYIGWCSPSAYLAGCLAGNAASGYDQGYYTLNITLNMITGPVPTYNKVGPNAGYAVGYLLPGSVRTTATSLTGGFPSVTTFPLTLQQTSSTGAVTCAGSFCFNNVFYPNSYLFAEFSNAGTGTNSANDPNAYGVEFYFDNYGMVYNPPSGQPWLGSYTQINLCSGNPTAGSPNPDQLVEESPNGAMAVVSGWSISTQSQRFAQQVSFSFSYLAYGPLITSVASGTVTTAWATVMQGTITCISTSTAGVYQAIGLYATRSSTNFVSSAVTSTVSLVGPGFAGSNNNLVYINSTTYPLGVDGSGWGYVSNTTTMYPNTANNAATLSANTNVQLIDGLIESTGSRPTTYSSAVMSFAVYPATVAAVSLPSSNLVTLFSGTGGGTTVVNNTVYVNQTVYVNTTVLVPTYINNTVTVYVPTYINNGSSSSSGSSLSNGQIAGIVIGCSLGVGLLCLLCLLGFFCLGRGSKYGGEGETVTKSSHSRMQNESSQVGETREVEMVNA